MSLPFHTLYLLVRDDKPIQLDVWYELTPYTPAQIAGDPNDSYPAEGGNILEYEVLLNGEPFELTVAEEEGMLMDIEETHYEP